MDFFFLLFLGEKNTKLYSKRWAFFIFTILPCGSWICTSSGPGSMLQAVSIFFNVYLLLYHASPNSFIKSAAHPSFVLRRRFFRFFSCCQLPFVAAFMCFLHLLACCQSCWAFLEPSSFSLSLSPTATRPDFAFPRWVTCAAFFLSRTRE